MGRESREVLVARALEGAAKSREPNPIYLKQSGQIYSVRDWDTLRRWISERRVDRNDLVSDGGVRWEPVGTHADLAPLFGNETPPGLGAGLVTGTPVHPAARATLPFDDTPFGGPASADGWTDEDTEGIPPGLPPLPTEARPAEISGTEAPAREVPREARAPETRPDAVLHSPHTPDTDEDERPHALSQPASESDSEPDVPDEPDDAEANEETEAWSGLRTMATMGLTPGPELTRELGPSRESRTRDRGPAPPGATTELRPRPPRPERAALGRDLETHPPPDPSRTGPTGRYVRSNVPRSELTERADQVRTAPPLADPSGPLSIDGDSVQTVKLPQPGRRGSDKSEALTEPLNLRELHETAGEVTAETRSADFPFEEEWALEHEPRPRRWLWALALAVTVLVLIPLAGWALSPWLLGWAPEPAPAPEPVVVPAPVHGTPEPPEPERPDPGRAEPGHAEPKAEPERVAPTPPPEPRPQAAPKPKPAPPKPAGMTPTEMVRRGWEAGDREQWDTARGWFDRARKADPKHEEASYGFGYALLMLNRVSEATPYLCNARRARSRDVSREAAGIVAQHKIACE